MELMAQTKCTNVYSSRILVTYNSEVLYWSISIVCYIYFFLNHVYLAAYFTDV